MQIMWTKIIVRHLWEIAVVLQGLLCATLLFKKSWKKFPIFSAYCFFSFAESAALYALIYSKKRYISPDTWIRGYWIAEVISIILGFGIIYEIFRKLLNSYSALHSLANTVFKWAFAVLVLLCFMILYIRFSPAHAPGAMYVVEEGVRTTEVGLLLFLFLFASAFGLHWRQSIFGIALGFGLFISIDLIAVTMRLHLPASLNIVRTLCFDISLLIWLGYLLIPEPTARTTDLPKLAQLEQWNQALMELIHQ